VAGLQAALIGAGFDVWWDMTHMPSRGLSFLQEIRDAIAGCDRLVLLVGPHALQSDYVRAEWQWALSAGKVVVPSSSRSSRTIAGGTAPRLPGCVDTREAPFSRRPSVASAGPCRRSVRS
jgi:hypothetical protein